MRPMTMTSPFSDALFQANGQDFRVNVSWGFAKQVLDTALAGYVDIINAVQHLFKCPTTYGDPVERSELENVVCEEVSECIRSLARLLPDLPAALPELHQARGFRRAPQ